jgi:hypothetical protein
MIEMRVKLAVGLFVGVASVLGSAHAIAATPTPAKATHYLCDSHQHLVVWRTANSASVEFIDRTYQLQRKASDLGVQYIAPKAALIIDGPEAVFVADDRLQLGRCVEANSLASR